MYAGLIFIVGYFMVMPLACELGVWLYSKGGNKH